VTPKTDGQTDGVTSRQDKQRANLIEVQNHLVLFALDSFHLHGPWLMFDVFQVDRCIPSQLIHLHHHHTTRLISLGPPTPATTTHSTTVLTSLTFRTNRQTERQLVQIHHHHVTRLITTPATTHSPMHSSPSKAAMAKPGQSKLLHYINPKSNLNLSPISYPVPMTNP